MKRKRHTPAQIVRKLRGRSDVERGDRADRVVAASRGVGVELVLHVGAAQYDGMKAGEAKRLKELERENAPLKKLLAEG